MTPSRMLLVNASPRGDASEVNQLVRRVVADSPWRDGDLVVRDLARAPLPPIDASYAQAIITGAPHDCPALDVSEQLIRELESTQALFIVTPMHNFTVPASLKLWLDYVIRIHRSFTPTPQGKVGTLAPRPAFVLISSGGHHTGERARQTDFLTPYLAYALGSIGIRVTRFFALQGLVAGEVALQAAITQTSDALAAALAAAAGDGSA